jgi:Bacteriophage abortive infection AbiH
MPKILITGNGFDLHHGLPTKYSDFIQFVSFVVNSNKTEGESITLNELLESLPNFISLDNFNIDQINFDDSLIRKIKEHAKDNPFFDIFKDILTLNTWIDFEKELGKIIDLIGNFITIYTNFSSTNQNLGQINIWNREGVAPHHAMIYRLQKVSLLRKLLIINDQPDGRYAKVNPIFLQNSVDNIQLDIDKISDHLMEILKKFIKLMGVYFSEVIPVFTRNLAEKEDSLLHALSSINQGEANENPFIFDLVYTFNYTNTVEMLYGQKDCKHLHGTADSTNADAIVLGVNSVANESAFLGFTKYYQKLLNGFFQKMEIQRERDRFGGGKPLDIYFWGHSLDTSDKEYIEYVFKSLSLGVGDKITILYHDDSARSRLLRNLILNVGKDRVEDLMHQEILHFCPTSPKKLINIARSRKQQDIVIPRGYM